jgi:hypothetical protein
MVVNLTTNCGKSAVELDDLASCRVQNLETDHKRKLTVIFWFFFLFDVVQLI